MPRNRHPSPPLSLPQRQFPAALQPLDLAPREGEEAADKSGGSLLIVGIRCLQPGPYPAADPGNLPQRAPANRPVVIQVFKPVILNPNRGASPLGQVRKRDRGSVPRPEPLPGL